MVIQRVAHTRWDCKYHIVWCPKYRKDLFSNEWLREYCWELFKNIAVEYECEIEAMEIATDHIHLLISIPPKMSVADAVRVFKSISAREIFEKFPSVKNRLWAGMLWKDGYFVRSVDSEITGETVKAYIESHKDREGSPAQLRLKFEKA
jgi:putative transposase